MKTCPVCSAKAFDDARICYGCMHSFEAEAQRTKEPSPLDTTTLDWLAPENLRPLSQASEDGWISGNDLPPWIETYKDDLDLDDAPLVEEGMHCEQLSQGGVQQDAAAPADVALYEEDSYEGSYEVPLEVYAESYADAMGDTQSNALSWSNNYYLDEYAPVQDGGVLANCTVFGPERRRGISPSQEVVVRFEFGWIDQAAVAPIRVQAHSDWLSKTPVSALSAS